MRFAQHENPDDLPVTATIDTSDGDLNIYLHRGSEKVRVMWIDTDGTLFRSYLDANQIAFFGLQANEDGRITLS